MINSGTIPLRLSFGNLRINPVDFTIFATPKRVNRLSPNELMLFGNFRFATIAKSIPNPQALYVQNGVGHPCSLFSSTFFQCPLFSRCKSTTIYLCLPISARLANIISLNSRNFRIFTNPKHHRTNPIQRP